jgi:ubiquinone/menaquinone biosynthesis C-methylase UbiE
MKSLLEEDSPYEELLGYHSEVLRLVKSKFIKNKTVLDVGCGFGWNESVFSKYSPKKIIGVDSSEETLDIARKFKHHACSFKKASALELPFKDNTFDTVMSWEVLEHIPKNTEEKMFSEIFRVLKPSGNFFLSTQHRNFFSTVLDPAWWFVGHRHYSTKKIRELSDKTGFKINRIYVKGGFFTIIRIVNMYTSKWILRKPPLYNSFFVKRTHVEYNREKGVVNIFLHTVKPK